MSNIDDSLDAITDAYLAYLEGQGAPLSLNSLPPSLRAEAAARYELLASMWGAKIPKPALEDDPVARRFGFDRPGQEILINGRRVGTLRKAASISLKDLTAKVNKAGGETTTMAMFHLEQSVSMPMPQRTATALVVALGTSLAALEATSPSDVDHVRVFLSSPDFAELIRGWAAEQAREPDPVRNIVSERLLVSQYRATDVTNEQLLDIARAILRSLD